MARMLRAVISAIRDNHEELSKLDAAVGDGDHGAAMLRVAGAIEETLDGLTTPTGAARSGKLDAILHDIGWAVMSAAGGSTSTLYGSLFMGMSEGVAGKDLLDCGAVAGMLEAGQTKLRKQTKAQEGDKTLVDALAPAVKAVREAAGSGRSVHEALSLGAEAAAKGAEATTGMRAKFGRARNLGDRVVGHADPGATSMSYVFAGLAEGAAE